MKESWHKTTCVLCELNCGLKVQVKKNRITTVLPDNNHPISKGYICRKGLHIADHQHHEDRLTHPLKKTSKGFEPVTWNQALSEISVRLKQIISDNKPKAFAFMGGMSKGCHLDAVFGKAFLRMIGSPFHYHSIAQEHTGWHWISGKMLGRQDSPPIPDTNHADMILAVGWDGMESHQMIRAPIILKTFATHPQKMLVVIDHRTTNTAKIADVHICIQPGTDALFAKSLIAIILQENWENSSYINSHVTGFDILRPCFLKWNIPLGLKACGINMDEAYVLCHELSTRKWCLKIEKGALMNRHSTIISYLYMILSIICGRLCTIGGNLIPGYVSPLVSQSDDDLTEFQKTIYLEYPPIGDFYPPNILPEEINNHHPDRIKALLICASNPIRSYADTHAFEQAFNKLKFLTVIDIALTETAEMADYVLPACSAYESWDTVFYPFTFPDIFLQLRKPLIQPTENAWESGTIITQLAEAMGFLPNISESLIQASGKDRYTFLLALLAFSKNASQFESAFPFVLSKTLGKAMKSSHLAALWGILQTQGTTFRKRADTAGFELTSGISSALSLYKLFAVSKSIITNLNFMPLAGLFPGVQQSEKIFQKLTESPEGTYLGHMDFNQNMKEIQTLDGRINLVIPELSDWLQSISPELESIRLKRTQQFPMILIAGCSAKTNAHTQIRKPDWNKGLRYCTVKMHPHDAQKYCIDDGQMVSVITKSGEITLELEISLSVQEGQVNIPHGSGLKYQGNSYGENVNNLTACQNRDQFSGIPLHQYVPCRVEAKNI
ncbi:molybdopterin dinucleotide binding domain protein [Candidatus Magnetomorum sp. HK-1]|nr:molybdopterin dinucleotide binding domain protein [Candidatus Magnetomorum sp. HK-1]